MKEKVAKQIDKTKYVLVNHNLIIKAEKFGYLIRGLIYVWLGWFGILLALGWRKKGANLADVIISSQKVAFGKLLLVMIVAGLGCYSMWGIFRGVFNIMEEENKPTGWLTRLGYLLSAVSYGSLAFTAWLLLLGDKVSAKISDPTPLGNKIWHLPYGRILLIVFGVAWLAAAIAQLITAIKDKVILIGKVGLVARAITFALIGFYIVRAALIFNPYKVYGLGQIMEILNKKSFGPAFVAALSIGLSVFGFYSVIISFKFKHPHELK